MIIGFLSDAHCGVIPDDNPARDAGLYSLLVTMLARCDKVVIVGDLLEMYTRRGGRKRHFEKIEYNYRLTTGLIRRNGARILCVEGNHYDGYLKMLSGSAAKYHLVDGYLFMHGHRSDPFFSHQTVEKITEKIIRAVFRVEGWLGGVTRFRLSAWVANHQHRNAAERDRLRRMALRMLESQPLLRGIVAGHTHIYDYFALPGGQVYFNAGAYLLGDAWVLDTKTRQFDRLGW